MKILGLDYGSRTTGIAISDETGSIAFPVETVVREEEIALKQTVRRIRQLTDENNTLAFKKRLERDLYQVEIVLWDERLSTVASERPLLEMGYDRHRRKKIVDNMAAAYILQGYLDAQKAGGNADNG